MKLYTYYRSSASYRVRIALNLKGLEYKNEFVHVRDKEQQSDSFLALNPQGLVPALEVDGQVLNQSLAIIEYLNDVYSEPPLLPADEISKAKIRAAAQMIACEIHPLNNLRVLHYLKNDLGHEQEKIDQWYRHWITEGFRALEKMLESDSKDNDFCFGKTASLADICLVPQMYNARRFNTDLSVFPILLRVDEHLRSMPEFDQASPENQVDAD